MERIKRYFFLLRLFIRDGYQRARFLKTKNYFMNQGEGCYFQIFNFGTEPHLISFGDNVVIATGVRFINHDIVSFVFNKKYKEDMPTKVNTINIGNNVFIGAGTIILPGVHIGDNVIVGAGSIVSKDISSGSVAVGCPCTHIGSFEEYHKKYQVVTKEYTWKQCDEDKAMKQIVFFSKGRV